MGGPAITGPINTKPFVPIQDRARKGQIINFGDLSFRGCTGTDIDACYDFYYEGLFLFFEYKLNNPNLSGGQKGTFVHLVDAIRDGNKQAAVAVCVHHVEDPNVDVHAGSCIVAKYYDGTTDTWINDGKRTAQEFMNDYIKIATSKAS